jgi:hypothetical protein
MSDRPLAERQQQILVVLLEHGEVGYYGMTANDIAYTLGFKDGGRRHGNGAAARGGWSGFMPPSNRVISSLRGLRDRGLVRLAARRDGLSGTADALTDEGRKVARELSAAGVRAKGTTT